MVEKVLGAYKAELPQNTYANTHQEEEKEEKGGNSYKERSKDVESVKPNQV